MNIEKGRVEVVALTFGAASKEEFRPLQEINLKPGQVVWLQTQNSEDYQIRFDDAFEC